MCQENTCHCSNEPSMTIGFHYIGEIGDEYSAESTIPFFPEYGESALTTIGQQLNQFLRQCTFVMPNDHILMESLTEDELYAVQDFLEEYRKECEST